MYNSVSVVHLNKQMSQWLHNSAWDIPQIIYSVLQYHAW